MQIFKGHTAPVTCLAFYEILEGTGYKRVLITGSWDKVITVLAILGEIADRLEDYQAMGYHCL